MTEIIHRYQIISFKQTFIFQQVEAALTNDPENEELTKLKADLQVG